MKVGDKIRKIRELKGITPKDMADKLELSASNYSRLERNEVLLSIDRLEVIAEIFGMKPEDVLTFDEKYVFHNYGEIRGGQNVGTYNNFPEEMKQLYEDKIALLQEKILWLQDKVNQLEKK